MLRNRIRDNRGSALLELALTLPLLAGLVICTAELGRVAYYAIELTNAARAGAAYACQNSAVAFASSPALTEEAAQSDAGGITLSWPTPPTQACTCETIYFSGAASTYNPSTPGSCTTSTVTGCTTTNSTETQAVIEYVEVAPQATLTTMFKYPAIPTSFTLHGFAQMRVLQEP